MRRRLVAGNWKMHKTIEETEGFLEAFLPAIVGISGVDVLLVPPYTSLDRAASRLSETPVALGAQDVHPERRGAFTGAISADMVRDCGCGYALVGHSERRNVFGDDDETVCRKLRAVIDAGLIPILCVGETLEERRAGETQRVLSTQLTGAFDRVDRVEASAMVVAYEPVWAIGTGETATPNQAQVAVAAIRAWVSGHYDSQTAERVRILYGGSVNPANIESLIDEADIDGVLVGGASLDADRFSQIVLMAAP